MSVKNRVSLIGRVPNTDKIKFDFRENAEDPKRNFLQGSISVQRSGPKPEGSDYPIEDLIRFKAFGHTAKYIATYVGIGGMMAVEGELQKADDWTDDQGGKHFGELFVLVREAMSLTRKEGETAKAKPTPALPKVPAKTATKAPEAAPGAAGGKPPFLGKPFGSPFKPGKS